MKSTVIEIGFSVDEVKCCYDDGLTGYLEAMPVDLERKSRQHGSLDLMRQKGSE